MYNRIPVMPVQPVILHHPSNLQITHLNVATGFTPTPSTGAQSTPGPNINHSCNQAFNQNSNIPFIPPPRDRKNLHSIYEESDRSNCSDEAAIENANIDKENNQMADKLNGIINSSSASEEFPDLIQINGPVDLKYIENFCIQAERIALKNQHRPCFKNIQHLCNRTRSDIMKPNTTVANIHSQGIPWALKDFIFAFIRLVNATHILHGYVDFKSGSLGKIENHLTNEFKNCYQGWEKLTKDQLIPAITKIIMELDSLSNSSAAQSAVPKNSYAQTAAVPPPNEDFNRSARMKQLDLVPETVFSQQRNVPGLLRVNLGDTQCVPIMSTADMALSDDESETETTSYINPGTHKPLPRKLPLPHLTPQPNVGLQMMGNDRELIRDDKHWKSAIESIKQMQLMPGISGDDMKIFADLETNPGMYSPQTVRASYLQAISGENAEKNADFLKLSAALLNEKNCLPKSNSDLLEFNGRDVTDTSGLADDESGNDTGSPSPPGSIQPKMLLKHHVDNEDGPKKCIQSRTYRKRLDFDLQQQQQQGYGKVLSRKCHPSMMGAWEMRGNGLTDKAVRTFDKIIKDLMVLDFGQHVATEKCLIGKVLLLFLVLRILLMIHNF